MALGELLAVLAVNQGHMGEDRAFPAQRIVDLALAGTVDQVVVAADDMGNAHVVVVDHHGEIVGGRTVRAQQDEIVELLCRPAHRALYRILQHHVAVGCAEADHVGRVGRRVGRVAVAPG